MFKKLPFILIFTILISVLLNNFIPLSTKQFIYACSVSIKSAINFLLPFLIFGLIFKTFVKLSDNAFSLILLIFGSVCVSNFFNTFNSQFLGSLLYKFDFFNFFSAFGASGSGGISAASASSSASSSTLIPTFDWQLPQLIKTDMALLAGIICGLIAVFANHKMAENFSSKIDFIVNKMFAVISILIPLFIVGFVVKCVSENILLNLLKGYFIIFVMCLCYMAIYTFALYFFVSGGALKKTIKMLKNMGSAFLTALSTMSSGVTMPVTIMCVEKNVKNKELAASTVSSTVNIHLLGDCIAIPSLAFAILRYSGMPEPTFAQYCVFALFFTIAKFSVAAIPAGGIVVMVPILERYLGFTPEMSSLIIALYVIWDPVITSFNVLGNGAFAKLIDQLYERFIARADVQKIQRA